MDRVCHPVRARRLGRWHRALCGSRRPAVACLRGRRFHDDCYPGDRRRRSRSFARCDRASPSNGRASHRGAGAGGIARPALRQDRRVGAGLVCRRTHRRGHAVDRRRGRAAANLFRSIRSASGDRGADAIGDFRLHCLLGRAGRDGDAGVCADHVDRSDGLYPYRAPQQPGPSAGAQIIWLRIPRRRPGIADPKGIRAKPRVWPSSGRAGPRALRTRACASCRPAL